MDKTLNRIRVQLEIQVGEDIRKNMNEAIAVGNEKAYRKWAITNHSLAHILTARSTADVCEHLLDAVVDYKRVAGSDLPTIKRMRDIVLSNLGGTEADELEEEFSKYEKAQF